MITSKSLFKIVLLSSFGLILGACQKELSLAENQMILGNSSKTEMNSLKPNPNNGPQYLLDLISTIKNMVHEGLLNEGNANALIVKIENAIKSIEKGNTNAVSGQLTALINEVEEFTAIGIIPQEEGQTLVNSAENGIILAEGGFTDPNDGYKYPVVLIGEQLWMAENLKTTSYRNGDLIGTTTPSTLDISNETAPKYQWAYNGNESNVSTMGRLYTFYTVIDSRGLCPTGWHVPSDGEWTTLTNYLGVAAGGKLKETGTAHWPSPNTGATNETGFTAIPGGLRSFDGYFLNFPYFARWWSTSEAWPGVARGRSVVNSSASVFSNFLNEKDGNSVRCIKD